MRVEVIERLREAARENGEVADLLDVLAESFCFFDSGEYRFVGSEENLVYLKSAVLARDFVEYDRRIPGRDGV